MRVLDMYTSNTMYSIRRIDYIVLFFKSKPSYSCQYASLTLLMLGLFLHNADRKMLESWANRRKDLGVTIDRTIGRRMQRLIVRSVARCYDRSCYRSLHPTIDRKARFPWSVFWSGFGADFVCACSAQSTRCF